MKLDEMNDFFAKRIDGYETQMLENVEGCKEGYIKLAELIPSGRAVGRILGISKNICLGSA